MTPDQQVKLYTAAIKKMLSDKHKGYKTVGSVAGGALGAGLGSATGLIKTINKHRQGELDELDNMGKVKEYLRSMGTHAGVGLGAGVLLGAGAGEVGRRMSANGPLAGIKKNLNIVAKNAPENTGKAGKYMYRKIKNEIPGMNLAENVRAQLTDLPDTLKARVKDIMNKNGAAIEQSGTATKLYHMLRGTLPKTMHAIEGGVVGGGLGAVGGGALGAVKGLISPGTTENAETGEVSPNSRIDAMLSSAGKGARIGARYLGAMGALSGVNAGHRFKKNREGLKDLFEKMEANTAAGRHWEHGIRRPETFDASLSRKQNHIIDI